MTEAVVVGLVVGPLCLIAGFVAGWCARAPVRRAPVDLEAELERIDQDTADPIPVPRTLSELRAQIEARGRMP